MGTNQDYKNRALASLEGKWGKAVVATFIYYFLTMGLDWVVTTPMGDNLTMSYSTSGILTLVFLPLGWGFIVYFLNLIRFEEINYSRLFDGYKDILRIFLATFLSYLVIVIGLCLLIVPGIILATGLLMTDFILKDDREISAIDAIARSIKLMDGHKVELFWLTLSFIGWAILSLLTLGIGFLLLAPYYESAAAHFYEDLKAEEANEVIA